MTKSPSREGRTRLKRLLLTLTYFPVSPRKTQPFSSTEKMRSRVEGGLQFPVPGLRLKLRAFQVEAFGYFLLQAYWTKFRASSTGANCHKSKW